MNSTIKSDNDFKSYFESLGYNIRWDFNHRMGRSWYELYEKGRLIAQIDMGVPLSCIVKDLNNMMTGAKTWESEYDYNICCPDDEQFNELCQRVNKSKYLRQKHE